MINKMDVITAGLGGHILAAAVRQNIAGSDPDVALMVGDGLKIRNAETGAITLSIPPVHLELANVDLREDVLLTARSFLLVGGLPEEGALPAGSPLVLNGATVTVNLPAAAPDGAAVWVYIEGAPQPVVQKLQVASGGSSAVEPLQLPSGNYRALVLATGVRAAVVAVSF